MNRDFTVVELGDFCFVDVCAGDVVADVCETGSCGESDIARADYRYGAHLFAFRERCERRSNLVTYAMLTTSRRFTVAGFVSPVSFGFLNGGFEALSAYTQRLGWWRSFLSSVGG